MVLGMPINGFPFCSGCLIYQLILFACKNVMLPPVLRVLLGSPLMASRQCLHLVPLTHAALSFCTGINLSLSVLFAMALVALLLLCLSGMMLFFVSSPYMPRTVIPTGIVFLIMFLIILIPLSQWSCWAISTLFLIVSWIFVVQIPLMTVEKVQHF